MEYMPTGDHARSWGGEWQRPSNVGVGGAEENGKQHPPFRLDLRGKEIPVMRRQ